MSSEMLKSLPLLCKKNVSKKYQELRSQAEMEMEVVMVFVLKVFERLGKNV